MVAVSTKDEPKTHYDPSAPVTTSTQQSNDSTVVNGSLVDDATIDDSGEEVKEAVAVGTVSHVIRRAFHSFYVLENEKAIVDTDGNERGHELSSPIAVPTPVASPAADLGDGTPQHEEVEAAQIPGKNLYTVLGETRKEYIQEELKARKAKMSELLAFLEQRHQEARAADDAIEEELRRKGLVVKAQIPMGPSSLRLDEKEIIHEFGEEISANLLHPRQLVRKYEQQRLERSGNGPEYQARRITGMNPEAIGYLDTTDSFDIRKESTLSQHHSLIQSVKTMHTLAKTKMEGKSSIIAGKSQIPMDEEYTKSGLIEASRHDEREKNKSKMMEPAEKRKNMDILLRMQTKLDYLRNPRYVTKEPELVDKDNLTETTEICFAVAPDPIEFTDYDIGGIYEQTVYVRNTSRLSRRLRVLPPATFYFSIHEIVFPDPSGLIAPGMHVQIRLRFAPDSRANYKDSMTIQYESANAGQNAQFIVPLTAHRPPPELSIPLLLKAQNTLVGDRSTTHILCKNTGAKGRFWFITEQDWNRYEADASLQGSNAISLVSMLQQSQLKVGPFALAPNQMELDRDESVMLQLHYVPSCIGEQREKFVMVCDNCLVRVFQLIGRGCQVEMSISVINSKQIDTDITNMGTLDEIFFDSLVIHSQAQQSVILSNDTPIDLKFAWKIGSSSIESEVAPFRIHPSSGVFPQNSRMEFTLSFCPSLARVYTTNATLSIEDIPQCSMPGPNQLNLLTDIFRSITEHTLSPIVTLDVVECLSIQLNGVGRLGSFSISPSICRFEHPTPTEKHEYYDRKRYCAQVVLATDNPVPVRFRWNTSRIKHRHLGIHWDSNYPSSDTFDLVITPLEGELAARSKLSVEIMFVPACSGAFSISVPCEIPTDDTTAESSGINFERWVLLEGIVDSGRVEILSPEVDFGLVLAGGSAETTISFRNPSSASANWRFLHTEAQSLVNSENGATQNNASTKSIHHSSGSLSNPKQLRRGSSHDSISSRYSIASSSSGNDTSRSSNLLFTSRDILPRATIAFVPDTGTLAPGEMQTIKAICFAGSLPERFRGSFRCQLMPEREFSGRAVTMFASVSARAEIQSPNVYLTPSKLQLGTTYLGVSVRRKLELVNVSNLEANFKFVEPQGASKAYEIAFSTKHGTIHSKETIPIEVIYTPRQAGKFTVLLACNVRGLVAPLGLEVTTNQKGLVVSYELLPPVDVSSTATTDTHTLRNIPKSPKEIALERGMSIFDCDLEPESNPLSSLPKLLFGDEIPLGQRRMIHLLIRNFSGIEAEISLEAKKFPVAPVHTKNVTEVSLTNGSNGSCSSNGAPSAGSRNSASQRSTMSKLKSTERQSLQQSSSSSFRSIGRRKPLLSDKHEHHKRLQSDQGRDYIRHRDEDAEDREVLSHDHGIAFQLHPSHLRIAPWEQAVVTATCFNNMPGSYSDDIVSRASGIPPVFLHTNATVVGTPLTLDRNCTGLYFFGKSNAHNSVKQPQPTLNFGQVCVRSPSITRKIRVINRGPKQARLKWKLYENGKENQLVTLTLRVDFGAKIQLRIVPCADNEMDFPFAVSPEQTLIPPFGTVPFQITYFPSKDALESPRVLMLADAHWYDTTHDHQTVSSGDTSTNTTTSIAGTDQEDDPTIDLRCETSPPPARKKSIKTSAAGKAFTAVRMANALSRPVSHEKAPPASVSSKCLRILLSADVVEPQLYVNKSIYSPSGGLQSSRSNPNSDVMSPSLRNLYHIKFQTWSTIAENPSDVAHPFHRKELYLVNHLSTRFTFRLESTGPFAVFRADSLAPKHPLSSTDLPSVHRRAQGESYMFTLPPEMSVRIDLRFDPSKANFQDQQTSATSTTTALRSGSQRLHTQIEGELLVRFSNQSAQTIRLTTEILRPLLVVSPSVYFFGHVHLSSKRAVVLRLANPTVVPASFSVQHIPVPLPISKAQKQEFTRHHSQFVDEPQVFEFSALTGVVNGPTTSLQSAGGALPRTNSTQDLGANHLVLVPMEITVVFRPKAIKKRYKSRFRFVIAHGNDFEIILEGEGHLDEQDVKDQDRAIVHTKALTHSTQIFTKPTMTRK